MVVILILFISTLFDSTPRDQPDIESSNNKVNVKDSNTDILNVKFEEDIISKLRLLRVKKHIVGKQIQRELIILQKILFY